MEVGSVSNGPAVGALTGGTTLGRDEFLKLLIAQLESQDPLNPTQDTEFVAQLAQFSSLEQQIQSNEALQGVTAAQDRMAAAQATSFLGNDVTFLGNRFDIAEAGETNKLDFFLGDQAETVEIDVVNADGVVVRQLAVSKLDAGRNHVTFDGLDQDGSALGPGEYTFDVRAEDADGASVAVDTISTGRVDSVEFSNGLILLQVGDRSVMLSDLLEVRPAG